MQASPLLLEILPDPTPCHLNHARILDRRGNLHFLVEIAVDRVLDQLSKHPPQRLARPRLGDHPFALDHAAQRCDRTDLLPHRLLDALEQFVGRNGRRGMVGGGEGDEREGKLSLQGVGYADYAAFGDVGVRRDRLLDGTCNA